jgi:hypothetical protein
MARIRTVKPKFWDDVKVGRLSRDARLLFLGLISQADDIGVVIGDPIWLKSKIFPYDQIQVQQFEKWMDELATLGFIRLLSYNGDGFVYLPNFARHQVINRPNYDDLFIPKNVIDNELHEITDDSVMIHGLISDQSVINHGTFTEGKERKGEEEELSPYGANSLRSSADADEPVGNPTAKPETVDYDALARFFNEETAGAFGTIKPPLGEKRRRMVGARIREKGKDAFAEMVRKASRSAFLKGQNARGFTATFDWLIKPSNFEKVLSGNYDNHNHHDDTKRNGACETEEQQREFLEHVAAGIARARNDMRDQGEL